MPKNINPELKKIGKYLKIDEDAVFSIPEYQRAYSWKTDNCDKLWQDITDYIDSDSNDRYFFGTIIINCQDNDRKLVLIDGQQRTTTFLLLLKALLIRINHAIDTMPHDGDSESLLLGLRERRRTIMGILYRAEAEDIPDVPNEEADSKIYKLPLIMENHSINERYKNELPTILRSSGFEDAADKVVQIKYRRQDNRYTNFFRNFKYFYEKIADLSDSKLNNFAKSITEKCEVIEIKSWQVEQAITMFNSLNSDGMPLCDSDIISAKLYASAEGNNTSQEYTKLWSQLTDEVEELKLLGVASIDSILMQQMYHVRAVKKEVLSEGGAIIVTTPGLRRYFTEINKDILKDPSKLCTEMVNLAKIWKVVAGYSVMKVLLKFNENSKLFLASYFHRFKPEDVTEEKVSVILESMLRLFAILELVDTGYSSAKFKTFLFGEDVKIADATVPVEDIKIDFDSHIKANWTQEYIGNEINSYEGNALVYLNEYLFAREKGYSFNLGVKCEIEHIMPSSGSSLETIRNDAGIADEDEFKGIVNKLGNKILLEEKINRAIGNEWFRTKVSTCLSKKTGYIDSNYPIAQDLVSRYRDANKPYWKKDDIIEATQKASKRIVKFIFDA